MADGYRILENGDLRVSEADEFRVTEKFYTASCSLVSSSTVSGLPTVSFSGSSSLSNVGSAVYVGYANRPAAARLDATSTVQPDADLVANGLSSLSSLGSASSLGLRIRNAEASLTVSGTLYTEAGFKLSGEFSGTATGTLANVSDFTASAVFDNTLDNIIRLTESGDVRVTEDGLDTRVALNVNANNVYAVIISDGVHIPFEATAYIKEDGVWKEFDPYVKWGGSWAFPDKVYKNISNTWKRVY